MTTLSPAAQPPLIAQSPAVRVLGIGTAVPPFSASQEEVLNFIYARFPVRESTRALYKRVLRNKSIRTRHFAFSGLADVLERDRDRINEYFRSAAVALSTAALDAAVRNSEITFHSIDFLAVTTCTGYLCPGLSSYLIDTCGLRQNVHALDIVGMGCGAALPALEEAAAYVRLHPGATAAVVCTEICTAAMFSNDEPDVVISNSIFSDGSAAIVLRSAEAPAHANGSGPHPPSLIDFASFVEPRWRDTLKFSTEDGYLKNVLGKRVPEQAAQALAAVVGELLEKRGLRRTDIDRWLLHAGGEKIISHAQKALGASDAQVASARAVLTRYGNMSSPSVLFVMAEDGAAHPPQSGDWGVLASFGAGFSAHAALVQF